MAEQITGEICHVYDSASAGRFVETLRRHADWVTFGLCMAQDVTCVLVEMAGVSFVFDPHGARSMAEAFLDTATLFPDCGDVGDFHKMVMSLRAAADKAERHAAAQHGA